jgi:hypothetical protein
LYNKCDYILTFISQPGTSAKFVGCYTVGAGIIADSSLMEEGFPAPKMFSEEGFCFELKESTLLSDLKYRLIIDWGKATLSGHQWATKCCVAVTCVLNKISGAFSDALLDFYCRK